jgi:ribose 5-phosphate isomerase B
MIIAFASDHGGFELKNFIINSIKHEYEILDLGTDSSESVDYPDFAEKAVTALREKKADQAIIFCGTGIGISIAANKFKGIRAALCHDQFTARMSKMHNNSNILVIGGRVTGPEVALDMVKTWLNTEFEGNRHQKRLNKIMEIEKREA